MSAPELKPCPFCGSGNLGSGGDDKVVGYWCKNCQAEGPNHYGSYEWNTRATSEADALRAENERLREALSAMLDLQDNASPFGGEMYRDRVDRVFDQCRAAMKGGDA